MGQVIIRNLPEPVIERLKAAAVTHGHSLEQELREVLTAAAYQRSALLDELALLRASTPSGPRMQSEDLVREGRDER
jgi:plasmid stability protein